AASDWVVATYRGWGIDARQEHYGSWIGWRRGAVSITLESPRSRSLEGTLLSWSPGTNGPIVAPVVALPAPADSLALRAFLSNARGSFVLLTPAEPSCRPDENWQRWATEPSLASARDARAAAY